jgi:hypothetical protein
MAANSRVQKLKRTIQETFARGVSFFMRVVTCCQTGECEIMSLLGTTKEAWLNINSVRVLLPGAPGFPIRIIHSAFFTISCQIRFDNK